MYRKAIEQLQLWKENKNKKPLIIRGARQVGKTWLMKEFGHTNYENVVYINFDNNTQMKTLFSTENRIEQIVVGMEIYTGKKINHSNTLIIFDEIQEVPQALSSLKYFNEIAPEYNIICAGSLLGVALHQGTSFPVGKVEFIDLYPLSFNEFIQALGKEQYVKLLVDENFELANSFSHDYISLLKQYYFVGGMPEAVNDFINNHDYQRVRTIQENILIAYEQDFSKHAPNEIVHRLRMLWNSIPAQLSKENKKFVYGLVRESARAKDYELALMWLSDCGLVHKVHRITTPSLPLKSYEDMKAFKLFLLDIGLLGCMVNLSSSALIDGNELFKEFKGALTEQFVLQQIKTLKNIGTYYWTNDRGSAEIDLLIDIETEIVPIEVKAETNLKAKSLKQYCEKFSPKIAIRSSLANYKKEQTLTNLPLWAIELIRQHVK